MIFLYKFSFENNKHPGPRARIPLEVALTLWLWHIVAQKLLLSPAQHLDMTEIMLTGT